MKHFIDIEAARLSSTEYIKSNALGFQPGDHILIQEKVDGSNASICLGEDGELHFFSRTKELTSPGGLRGFFDLGRTLSLNPVFLAAFLAHPDWVVFGEWDLCCNKIKDYSPEHQKKWIIYDIFDKKQGRWQPFEVTKAFFAEIASCEGIELIHALYDGPFLSWDHCQNFLHQNTYGPTQEGIVVKNQDRMYDEDSRECFYLKIVNEVYLETKHKAHSAPSPEELNEKERVETLTASIVTERRVEKAIERLRDAGALPDALTPKDMGLVAKLLPKAVYDDCLKEEAQLVKEIGPSFGKASSTATMRLARKIILGS